MNVRQAFLHDPEEGGLHFSQEPTGFGWENKIDENPAPLREAVHVPTHSEISPDSSNNGGCKRYESVRGSRLMLGQGQALTERLSGLIAQCVGLHLNHR